MKLTNRLGLPDAIVKAVANDDYVRGDANYTVTELLQPPRITALTRLHRDDIEEDVSDRIWALLGTVMHGILERAETVASVEERLTASILVEALPYTVSGKYDRCAVLPDGLMQDYKLCSVWENIKGLKPEREQQLNMLKWIAEKNGIPIKRLEVVAIYRDWSKPKSREGGNYPSQQVSVIPVELWTPERAEQFIASRILMHEQSKATLPECTDDDRWASEVKYAVMKQGNKRAVRVLDTVDDANAYIASNGLKGHYIEERRADPVKRCRDYCPCAPFCAQAKELGL